MALPADRCCDDADGVGIAFHALGDGPAVRCFSRAGVNHLALNWPVPSSWCHRVLRPLLHRRQSRFSRCRALRAPHFRLSLDTFAEDLDAVLAALRLERVALLAIGPATVVACHVAARWPHRVASLVVIEGGVSEANRRVLGLRHVNSHVEAKMRGALVSGIEDRDCRFSCRSRSRGDAARSLQFGRMSSTAPMCWTSPRAWLRRRSTSTLRMTK